MGGRGASSSTNMAKLEANYKKEKADSRDRLMNDIKETRERQKQKANEYIEQGIPQPEAFARAKQEFEREFEKLDREEEQRSFDINEKYRKKGLLAKNVTKIKVRGKEWKKKK